MNRPTVKLKLDLRSFDEGPFVSVLKTCEKAGIRFETMLTVGDTPANRLKLYELNRDCSRDIPARGAFFSFDDYRQARFERPVYDPRGIMLALDQDLWAGMAASSNWSHKGFVFNEMTGVLRDYRRRGIALAMKLLGIRFARDCGVETIYTLHDFENESAIGMNRRLGFVDTDWQSLT